MSIKLDGSVPMDVKHKFQIFTPTDIIEDMLDLAEYKENLFGKRILENSFGDGRFLVAIASRYIKDATTQGMTREAIRKGLENDLVGYELDSTLVERARSSLDKVAKKYGVDDVRWDLRTTDFLFDAPDERFSFIVGNPPYLEYKCLNASYRNELKTVYETCSYGKFDYCYAFVEAALARLDKTGVLVQLIPNSIFKNVSASELRRQLSAGVTDVVDYAGVTVFTNALVSPCVFRFDLNPPSDMFSYYQVGRKDVKNFCRKDYGAEKWVFESTDDIRPLDDNEKIMFRASAPIATLCNEAFFAEDGEVEDDLMRPAISPRLARRQEYRSMIFPYQVEKDGTVHRLSEYQLARAYPKTYRHLHESKEKLEMRAADSSVHWFEFGRTQGLDIVNKKKLLMSTIVTKKVNVYELDAGDIPFGGIVITAKDKASSLQNAKRLLESDRFITYALSIGTHVSGHSVRITCADVNRFFSFHI